MSQHRPGTPGEDVDELLRLLGNEARMAIMRALWAEFDFADYVVEEREATSFSALREATGIRDSGNFNYHLDQLTGTLVADREDGYVLTPLGFNLMRSIERYADFAPGTVAPTTVEDPCPFCDGDLVAGYEREMVSVRCRNCEGLGDGGNVTHVRFPATGAGRLSLAELLDAATLTLVSKLSASRHGVCWDCRARMERSPDVCDGHERGPGGVCDDCGHRFGVTVDADCPNCGASGHGPLLEYAVVSPAVAAFFDARDRGPEAVGPWRYRLAALGAAEETAREPGAVAVAFRLDGDACRVTVEDGPDGLVVASHRP